MIHRGERAGAARRRRRRPTAWIAVFTAVGLGLLAGCRSPAITSGTVESERTKVFNAAREVLRKRFGTFSVADEAAGKLVTTPHQPYAASNSRYLISVAVSEDEPPRIDIEVAAEVLSFNGQQVSWTRVPRGEKEQQVEGYVLEEIRAKLEDREPDLPSLEELDGLEPPAPKHRVPTNPAAPKRTDPDSPGRAPTLPPP